MVGSMRKGFIGLSLICTLVLFSSAVSAATASATLNAGSVSITTPPSNFSYTGTLTGDILNLSSSSAVSVNDPSGSKAGWNLQAAIGVMTATGGATIPASAHTIQSVAISGVTGTGPTNSVLYPLAIPTTTAKIFSANASTGMGRSTETFTTQLAVPADAASGPYTATLTLTIASGP